MLVPKPPVLQLAQARGQLWLRLHYLILASVHATLRLVV